MGHSLAKILPCSQIQDARSKYNPEALFQHPTAEAVQLYVWFSAVQSESHLFANQCFQVEAG
jgi:hypothetical protein